MIFGRSCVYRPLVPCRHTRAPIRPRSDRLDAPISRNLPAMSRFFPWPSAAMLSALLLVAGCGKQLQRAGTEVLEQTYAIDPAARLKIRNLRGSIAIHGTDTRELKLRATKKTESAAQLQDINI